MSMVNNGDRHLKKLLLKRLINYEQQYKSKMIWNINNSAWVWPDDNSASEDHHEADTNDAPGRVIKWQWVVEDGVLDGTQIA